MSGKSGRAAKAGETVLVVEDEVLLRLTIAAYLRDCGYEVIEAADADEAVLVLQQPELDIDVLFTDIEMPGAMDGFGLAQWTRANRPGLDVILTDRHRAPRRQRRGPPVRGRPDTEAVRAAIGARPHSPALGGAAAQAAGGQAEKAIAAAGSGRRAIISLIVKAKSVVQSVPHGSLSVPKPHRQFFAGRLKSGRENGNRTAREPCLRP